MNYASLTTAWMFGAISGFFLGVTVASKSRRLTCRELMTPRDRDPDWRRPLTHENHNAPTGPPPLKLKRSKSIRMDEGIIQRGNGYSGPTTPKPDITPKPQPTGGRQIGPFF